MYSIKDSFCGGLDCCSRAAAFQAIEGCSACQVNQSTHVLKWVGALRSKCERHGRAASTTVRGNQSYEFMHCTYSGSA